jgi:hypothetical protein
MVRYRASFRKVAHYRVRLLRDLVDELSDGAECDFRNRLAEYFRAIWSWLNFDEKRQRTQQQNAHISAGRHLVGYGAPFGPFKSTAPSSVLPTTWQLHQK